jgi:hypothetical protein
MGARQTKKSEADLLEITDQFAGGEFKVSH